ncbi:hypothetical protein EV182_007594, partial [Spiromyces aspiralis]
IDPVGNTPSSIDSDDNDDDNDDGGGGDDNGSSNGDRSNSAASYNTETRAAQLAASDPRVRNQVLRRLRRRLINSKLRYAIGSGLHGQLFRKLVLRLATGVRLGLSFCAQVKPNSQGQILNHWQIVPVGREQLTEEELARHDAYDGYRSVFLHCQMALTCPYKVAGSSDVASNGGGSNISHHYHNESQTARGNPKGKPYNQWTPAEIDSRFSPLYKLNVARHHNLAQLQSSEDSHGFFQRFDPSKQPKDAFRNWVIPDSFKLYQPSRYTSQPGWPKTAQGVVQ